MKIKEINKSDVKQKEIDKLHPDFGLIKYELENINIKLDIPLND